ncbi:MAG: hypothetical protein K8S18_10330 [Desulfobacula sp.]|nr:hypothetical protein [Desulfobacula sp.]
MKTQYITDDRGNKLAVILPIKDYNELIENSEELENIRLYDEAKKEDDGEHILFSDYIEKRKTIR